jgi:dihydrolipoamide dehydrogenase
MAVIYDYDLVVIGSGPGGYVAAIRAAQLKQKVAIIEKEKIGGVCLNIGCIPSKALINQAETYKSTTALESMGIKVDTSGFDYSKVFAASRKAADSLSKGVAFLMKKNGITVISGTGVLESAHEVSVDGTRVSAKAIILATGSRPREIPGFEFDENIVLSSTGGLMLQQLPKKLLILGGGAIGVEFAHIMNAFGVEVHLVEMMDRILPIEDSEISEMLRKSFQRRGVQVYTSTKALSLVKKDHSATATLMGADNLQFTLDIDKVLCVVGRVPNTSNIGLEKIGITTEKGFILTGDYCETSVKGIYAIGDIVPTPLLAHVASKEGEIAAEHIAGHETTKRIDKNAIPGAVYCEPQVASFGLTEAEALKKNIKCKSFSFPYKGVGKSVAIGKSEGIVKIVAEETTHEILGAHIIGTDATEIIHEILLAKKSELLPQDIATMIHAHPTISEGVMEAARAVEGWAIHV